MPLSTEEARKVAALARLALDEATLARLAGQLDAVVGYVEQLKEVDVEGVEPLFHPTPMPLRRRPDEVAPVAGRRALEGSAGYVDGLVRVPRIIEEP